MSAEEAAAPPVAQPAKKREKRAKVQFKLVQQSYEDKDYETNPKPVLVPAALADQRYKKRRKNDTPMFVFGEDMPEDYSNKRNMLMADDTRPGEESLFEDMAEEEFDEEFIQEMMYGEVDEEDAELFGEYDDMDDESYPQHDTNQRAIDKQFSKMMREFEFDEEINDPETDDPRTRGPLEIDQYMTALEEFVENNVGYSTETAEPCKNKGLINQLKMMSHKNRIFDSNKDGVFLTTMLVDKKVRWIDEFRKSTEETLAAANERYQEYLARKQARRDAGLPSEDEAEVAEAEEEEEKEFEVVEIKPKERVDCETVLSTYSTLYNHPNIIAAAKKKMNPNKAVAMERQRQMKAREEAAMVKAMTEASPQDEEEEEEDGNDPLDTAAAMGIDLTLRPKDESAEEKKLRRQLVKQLQREKREQKKQLKTAYRDATVNQNFITPVSKAAKSQVSLSMGKHMK